MATTPTGLESRNHPPTIQLGGIELNRANMSALSGMTLWHDEANGCHAQWLTADWTLTLYVLPTRGGVALVGKDGSLYARTERDYVR